MKKNILKLFIVLIIIVGISTFGLARVGDYMPDKIKKPMQAIWDALMDLQVQIDSVDVRITALEGGCADGQQRVCGSDEGECTIGFETCVDGHWGYCTGGIPPASEECDNQDNDCDGIVDDLIQDCGFNNVGECQFGIETCTNGDWGGCVGDVMPTDEICDELDNDCDGQIDEECGECTPGETSTCSISNQYGTCTGLEICSFEDVWGACTGPAPELEVCDDIDNNCDGQIDEGCE